MYSPSTLGETDEIISGSSLVVVTTNQISSHVGDEVVILNLTTGVYHGLNEVGSRIWSLIEEPKSLQSIQEILLAEYEVEATDFR
jgi:hypothetical protein